MHQTDVRQSPFFARFMEDIGWRVEQIDNQSIYMRKFPLIGFFAKMLRSRFPLDFHQVRLFLQKNKVYTMKLSPYVYQNHKQREKFFKEIKENKFKVDVSPFNPTTTIVIYLKPTEKILFSRFSSAKRRAVRRSIKYEVFVKESSHIDAFIEIRKHQYRPVGFLVTSEMKALWKNFYPTGHSTLLLAYSPKYKQAVKPLAGILLLFYESIAYYWYASALPIGKKFFAPTLLVWEALKVAKRRKCSLFDFEGIYDERFPKASQSWRGFTKFKEGFGGKTVVLMENFTK